MTPTERYLQRPPRIGRRRRKKTGGVWFMGAEWKEPLRGRESFVGPDAPEEPRDIGTAKVPLDFLARVALENSF